MASLLKRKKFITVKDKEREKDAANVIVCPACKKELVKIEVVANKYVCYECGSYFRVRTSNRIKMVADQKSFEPWFDEMESSNPLDFSGYEEKIITAQEKTGLHEAVTVGEAKIYGEPVVLGICDARFMMSSMGHVVGEKIALAVELATKKRLPVVLFCCSGGARMQEGIISLMQMAKTSAALKKHSDAGLLYIPVLTDPTTGGVTASFAMLGDIILAEPGALIGFAGPRVIEQTIGQKLPEGFQRAEFQLEHGFVDAIVERKDLKKTLYRILKLHRQKEGYANFETESEKKFLPSELMKERSAKSKMMNAWDKVKAVRDVRRLSSVDYIDEIFDGFMELHGDRLFRDDPAVVGGIAALDGQPVTVIGVHKGRDLKDCMRHNYGMPSPEGYRKALRLMKQAEKFGRPVICFVDTSGACCGVGAEERGQGQAIAENLLELSTLCVPVISILVGEGGSGGALALAVADRVWMLQNAVYSVISPEGCASILWKDSSKAAEAAASLRLTAEDAKSLGIVERILSEKELGKKEFYHRIRALLEEELESLAQDSDLVSKRYERFRRIGSSAVCGAKESL